MQNLKNSWALVTGASSGIGEEYAKQLAERGLNVIVVARRADRLQALKEKLEKLYSVRIDTIAADLLQENACQEVFEKATADGRQIQVLINNAGMGNYGPFLEQSLDVHLKTIQLNIVSLTKLTYLFTQHMLAHQKPSYVTNIASVAAYQAIPYFGVYTGSKKYVKDLTDTLNYEYKKTNVHFTCVSPGGTYTEFMDHAGQVLKKSAHMGMMPAENVARIGIRAMFCKKSSVVTGCLNKIVTFLPRFFPTKWSICIGHCAMQSTVSIQGKEGEESNKGSKSSCCAH